MTEHLYCSMCGNDIKFDDYGIFAYQDTMILCDECGSYIKNMIKEYNR